MSKRNSKTTVAVIDPAREVADIRAFLRNTNQDEVMNAIMASDHRPKFKKLLDECKTPACFKSSFTELCGKVGLTCREITDAYADYKTMQAKVSLMDRLPETMQVVVADAIKSERDCPRCQGAGELESESGSRPCPRCNGTGVLAAKGDTVARKLVFEASGFTGKTGPLVAQQFNIQGGSLNDTLKWADSMLEDE